MKHIPPRNAEIDLWILYSHSSDGLFVEGIFTHKVQAEAMKRYYEEDAPLNTRYSLMERTTQPHGEGQ